jgi:hypothetical protein
VIDDPRFEQIIDAVLAGEITHKEAMSKVSKLDNLNELAVARAEDAPFEIDEVVRASMEANDQAAMAAANAELLERTRPEVVLERLSHFESMAWGIEQRMRKLEGRVNEVHAMDIQKGTLTQRVQALESSVSLFQRSVIEKPKRNEEKRTRNTVSDGRSMRGWTDRQLMKTREAVIEALLEGGERFELLSDAHIEEYGDYALDCPLDAQHVDAPNFIVLDALPDVLRQDFAGRFAPVASLIRQGATPLTLARFEDWQAFARAFA